MLPKYLLPPGVPAHAALTRVSASLECSFPLVDDEMFDGLLCQLDHVNQDLSSVATKTPTNSDADRNHQSRR
jgi:hypothetical protein